MMPNPKFFDLLISRKILTQKDADNLLEKYKGDAFAVLNHLVRGTVAKKSTLGMLWGDSIGVSYVDLNKTLFQSQVVHKLPKQFAQKNMMIPLYQMGETVTVAAAFPTDQDMIKSAEMVIRGPISPVFAFPEDIDDAIDVQYQSEESLNSLLNQIADSALFKGISKITGEQIHKLAGDQAVVELCRGIMMLGIKERASDIHIEPQEDVVRIRYRIDGALQEKLTLDHSLLPPLFSRFKVLAKLDITEKRRPQDGRVTISLSNKTIDFRLSTVPTIYGEKIVLRILGQIQADDVQNLSELDLSKSVFTNLKKIIDTPNGVFFVTGPTGSGKTTTLFSVLKSLNKAEVNIMTIEDPVEYRLSGINQIQVNPAINLDFASTFRSFLRQDPDVILIGEIRDLETAKIAAQAALTGHLVLATMHTNNALQAVTRLVEIGVEPFLVAPSIIGVMAQRLVRAICPHCKEKYQLSKEKIERYFIWDNETEVFFYRGRGCLECNRTGYLGRLAIHELFIITETIRSMVAKGASIIEIEQEARNTGFETMRYDGLKKVLRGLTTIDEIEKVTIAEEALDSM